MSYRLPAGLVLSLLVACGSSSKARPAPAEQSEPVVAKAAPEPAPDPAAEPAFCRDLGPPYELLSALEFGDALSDIDLGAQGGERRSDLTAAFPAIGAAGGKVAAVTLVEVDGAAPAEVAAFVVPKGGEPNEETRGAAAQLDLWLLGCGNGKLEPVAAPITKLGDRNWLTVMASQLVPLPGGGRGTMLRLLWASQLGELVVYETLLGKGSASLPVTRPKGAAVGVLGLLQVGAQTAWEGGYTREMPLGGSGWFPLGDEQLFVNIYAYREPSWSDSIVSPMLTGRLGADGIANRFDDVPDAWLLLGRGEMPAWCKKSPAKLRCSAIDADDVKRATGNPPHYQWMAGLWASATQATADLTAVGATPDAGDWMFLGEVRTPMEGETIEELEADGYRTSPPPAPGGKKPVRAIVDNPKPPPDDEGQEY